MPESQGVEPDSGAHAHAAEPGWGERAGRLYADLERPARAMVRRAFRGAFTDDELDDIYAAAWLGTLRTLGRRHRELSDEQVRKYLLAAVANHASKELRRRKRRPTAPLEIADAVPDAAGCPDEQAEGAERTRVVRDLLTALPPRRRAVILLRYGWGLEPRQVCELVGLSARAYRREITRGVDELSEGMRQIERGEWCAERSAVLKSYAGGLADVEGNRQARAHLAHCRPCAGFVAALRTRLHDAGAGVGLAILFSELHNGPSITAEIAAGLERARDATFALLPRGGDRIQESVGGLAAAGGARGAAEGAGVGLLAKLGELGAAGKVAVACLASGAAATACVGTSAISGFGAIGVSAQAEQPAAATAGGTAQAGPNAAHLAVADGSAAAGEAEADPQTGYPADSQAVSPSPGAQRPEADVPPADLEFSGTAAASRSDRDGSSAAGSASQSTDTGGGGSGHALAEFGGGGGGGAGGAGSGGAGGAGSGSDSSPPTHTGEFGGP